jgi:hypothetical protein
VQRTGIFAINNKVKMVSCRLRFVRRGTSLAHLGLAQLKQCDRIHYSKARLHRHFVHVGRCTQLIGVRASLMDASILKEKKEAG